MTPVRQFLNNCMNKSALQEIQKTLNLISKQIDVVDAETKWAALELMLGASTSVVVLAKMLTKPDTKIVTYTISIPKTKVIKQPVQQPIYKTTNDAERTDTKIIIPQKPLSNQQASQ